MSPGRGEGRRRARAGAGHARVHTGKGDETTSGPTKLQTTQHGDGAAAELCRRLKQAAFSTVESKRTGVLI